MTLASAGANLGGIALFVLPGLGLAELFAALRRLPLARRLGYAYLLGIVSLAGGLFALGHGFGMRLTRPSILIVAFAPLAAGIAHRAWNRTARASAPARSPRVGSKRPVWYLSARLALCAVVLGPLLSALTAPLADWDGRMTWTPLAVAMRHETTVDPSVMREPQWFVVNSRYPPLLSIAQATVQEAFRAGEDEQFFRGLYVGLLVALLSVIYDGASRIAGKSAALLTTLCVALPPFLSYGPGGATSAYSDIALGCFYGAALVWLLLAKPTTGTALLGGLFLAGATLTKSEGMWLVVPAILLAALRLQRRAVARTVALRVTAIALPALFAAALLAHWRAGNPNRLDVDYFGGLHLPDVARQAIARFPVIVREVFHSTFNAPDWVGFWIVAILLALAGGHALVRVRVRLVILAALVPCAIGWAAYVVTPGFQELVGQTWDRFLLQGMVGLAIAFAAALRAAWPRPAATGL